MHEKKRYVKCLNKNATREFVTILNGCVVNKLTEVAVREDSNFKEF